MSIVTFGWGSGAISTSGWGAGAAGVVITPPYTPIIEEAVVLVPQLEEGTPQSEDALAAAPVVPAVATYAATRPEAVAEEARPDVDALAADVAAALEALELGPTTETGGERGPEVEGDIVEPSVQTSGDFRPGCVESTQVVPDIEEDSD